MPNSPDIDTAASTSVAAARTATLGNILLYFPFYRNLSSKYVTR